jgi:hypothetical protein
VAVEGLKEFGKYPGEWYGVNTASQVFQILCEKYYTPLKIVVLNEGQLIGTEITSKACDTDKN